MKNYYNALQAKILKYRRLFGKQTNWVAIRLIIWNIKYLCSFSHKPSLSKDRQTLSIAVAFYGGLGDFLVALNYLAYLKKYLSGSSCRFDVFCESSRMRMAKAFYSDEIKDAKQIFSGKYDLILSLRRFPKVEFAHQERIALMNPKLVSLIEHYYRFEENFSIVFLPFLSSCRDNIAINRSLVEKKIRLQQPDIDGILGIETDYLAKIPVAENSREIFQQLGVQEKYITINRGVDDQSTTADNTKMWPLEYYNELILLLKKRYPEYQFIQLGVSVDRSPLIDHIDLNLVGKTTLSDLKVLLKNAALHIDGEGGMVHLRHALNGGVSVVLFGPTSLEFYNYPENINLNANVCSWCEWVHENWQSECLQTGKKALCMQKLTPAIVFEKVQQLFNVSE